MNTPANALERGVFMLTFDVELAWGTYYAMGAGAPPSRLDYREVRSVVEEILELLDRTGIAATWAFVGHLFLDGCEPGAGPPHPDVVRPRYPWFRGDWFRFDPCSSEEESPGWYGTELLEAIRSRSTPHEIGCHSFSHILFGDPDCSVEAAASDLRRSTEAARAVGVEMKSFVFPQNKVRHETLLPAHGLKIYRELDGRWYYRASWTSGLLRKALHMADQCLGLAPPVVMPVSKGGDLWAVPGSLPLLPPIGFRRYLPMSVRVLKAKRGVDRAIACRRIYHLWSHPWNFLYQRDRMVRALSEICRYVAERRDAGELETLTMEALHTLVDNGAVGAGV